MSDIDNCATHPATALDCDAVRGLVCPDCDAEAVASVVAAPRRLARAARLKALAAARRVLPAWLFPYYTHAEMLQSLRALQEGK